MTYVFIALICFTVIAFGYGLSLAIAQYRKQKRELELTRKEIYSLKQIKL